MYKIIIVCLLTWPLSLIAKDHEAFYLEYIGQEIIPTLTLFEDVYFGGLSGIEYDPQSDRFVAISDDPGFAGPVRYYDLAIDLSDGFLSSGDVQITAMTEILDSDGTSFELGSVDPESIRLTPFPGLLYWTSEGDFFNTKKPFVRVMTRMGQPIGEFSVPDKYMPTGESGVRLNLGFESLTFSNKRRSVITATENALVQDGPIADLEVGSPCRVLILDNQTGLPQAEYVYLTDPIPAEPIPADGFSDNGLVELLSVDKHNIIALERSFSEGVGNSIRLYLATTRGATNVIDVDSLQTLKKYRVMRKILLLDLSALGISLDNFEGITFGPRLATGERTLVLVSDNNFNPVNQVTQFIAFKIIEET